MNKREKMKRVTALILVFVTVLSMVFGNVQNVNALTGNSPAVAGMEQMVVKGENSFGNLLVSELETKQNEQEENNGCNIFSIEVSGKEAAVSFETVEDCTLVVGIYDEAGEKMLASGSREVLSGETDIVVFIETDNMPQYFYVRGFLVDTVSFRPLCSSYESPNYTKEMQDFFAKTTDDFAQDKVINFDDDKTNNFAVFSENTKVIQESTVSNQVVRADDEQNIYVIENADNNITSLRVGDVFAQKYDDNNILIVKVASIQIDGTTVTITGDEISLEEVFDYVKIEGESKTEDAVVDSSSCEEGVIYNGLVETQYERVLNDSEVIDGNELYAIEGEEETKATLSFNFVNKEIGSKGSNIKINGGLNFEIVCSIKFYISLSYSYLEMKLEYSAKMQVSVSGKVQGEIPLAPVSFSPVPGVNVKFTPAYIVEVSAKIDLKGELSGCIGFSASTENGTKDLTSKPSFNAAVKLEGKVFIGLQLEPEIEIGVEVKKIIKLILAEASIKSRIGVEITASMKKEAGKKEAVKLHECKNCLEGKFVGKYELSFEVKFLSDHIKSEFKLFNFSEPITDFYYSWDFNEFAFTTCPHCQYKVSVLVKDSNGNPVNDAVVNDQYHTDENGKTSFFLPDGEYGITVKKDGNTTTREIMIQGEAQSITIALGSGGSSGGSSDASVKVELLSLGGLYSGAITKDGSLYTWGDNWCGQLGGRTSTVPIKVIENVEMVSLGSKHSGAITKDGSLYMWGSNYSGELLFGSPFGTRPVEYRPIKVVKEELKNVETVSLGGGHSGAIAKDGSLYMWGRNDYGQRGEGTTTDGYVSVKVLENVETVSLGGSHSGAVTKDGSLYMWGRNAYGQLGDGTTTSNRVPIKVLENVETVSLGDSHSGAITKDGSLHMWGDNECGQLGNGTTTDSTVPIKVLENVEMVSLGGSHSGAITKDGSLYMWGDNEYGQLGNGTTTDSTVPIKVLENVEMVSLGESHSGAITKDGSLYMWGDNEYGQLGDGTTSNSLIPKKIELPISTSVADVYVSFQQETYELSYKNTSSNETLTNLVPNETYNFYIMKSNTENNALGANNLLYIRQAVSDSEGKLNVTYEPKGNYVNASIFAVAMHQNNLSQAQVELGNLTYNGLEQYVKPVVSYNGIALTEGKDYELHRDYSAMEAGEYTVVICGIGNYFGTKEVNYSVVGNSQPSQPDPVRDFVNRLYTIVLEREADEGGLDSWTNVLVNHQSSGVDASYGFIFSKECRERNLSNDEFVEILYNTFMNRPSDEGGKSAWVSQLDAGVEREKIFEGFVYSQEFAIICSDYGIDIGDVQDVAPLWAVLHNYRNRNADVTKFVARCYTEALERAYETEGLESWCRVIHEKSNTPKQVAQNFIFSDEFVSKNLNSEEYVKVLYQTFMGREADEAGLASWVNVLESGREDRAKVLEGFSDSAEFAEILQQFGLR